MSKRAMKLACLSLAVLLTFACMLACSPGAARADDDASLFFLSPSYSWYMPTSGKVKDAFGSTWDGFGVVLNLESFAWTNMLRAGDFRLHPYFGYYRSTANGNEATLIPIGLEGRWSLAGTEHFRPYFGLGLSGYAVNLEDNSRGVDSGWRAAFGGRVMVGADLTRWFNLQASYNVVSDVKGYDLGGFGILAKINFYF